jgi:RNA polymerase sigma-70 factor (ECF subfamily)
VKSETSSPEVQLIQQAVAGDAAAFARLYDTYVDEVYRFVYYRVSDKDTAEDLTSQTFLKAWDNMGRYRLRGSPFKAWLFQIARNLVIDYYRTRKETLPLDPHGLEQPDPEANVTSVVERRLEAERLRDLLRRLTEEQREVLILKFINGFSTKDVARMMRKGPGAIRALQMRGLQALADIIEIDDE